MEGFQTYEWETQFEIDYRMAIVELSQDIANNLALFEDIAKKSERDYSGLKESMRKLQRKHKGLSAPSMYEEANSFIAEALNSYLKGIDLIIKATAVKDSQGTYRAARNIIEGNNFICIAKNRMWEAIESRVAEAVH
jgi:hypothetical protein